jgi:plastocyanin
MIDQFTPSSNGAFSKEYRAAGSLWKDTGAYTLEANVNRSTADTNFSIKTGVPDNLLTTPQSKTTVSIPYGTATPGCEEDNRCYNPYNAHVKVGGTVTWNNDDSAAHTVTAGTPSDGPTGIFDSSLLMAGSSFSHTFNESGEFDYFCMVHPWQQGIITVGDSGSRPTPEPSPKSDLEIFVNDRVYDIGDTVLLGVEIDGSDRTNQVAIDVSDPRGTTIVSRTLSIAPDSSESLEFRISEDFKTGNYKVIATTSIDGKTIKDSAHFKVKSQYNEFKIESVSITDQKGNPSTLQKGDVGFVKVKLDSKKNIATLVTVNIFDSKQTSIGIGSVKATLAAGESEIILSFNIPQKMASGDSQIFVNAFSDWPSSGGIPQTLESKITERVR